MTELTEMYVRKILERNGYKKIRRKWGRKIGNKKEIIIAGDKEWERIWVHLNNGFYEISSKNRNGGIKTGVLKYPD